MRPDGSIERWHEIPDGYAATGAPWSTTRGDAQQRTRGDSSVSRLWKLMDLSLKEHQTWFQSHHSNPKKIYFPFARYMERGMKIYNMTKGVTYTVAAHGKEKMIYRGAPDDLELRWVLLTGSSVMPDKEDRLRFPEKQYIVFRPTNPRSHSSSSGFDRTGTEDATDMNDTITYLLLRREPGSVSDRPFGRTRERIPRFRAMETVPGTTQKYETRGQLFDNITQFDCWSKTDTEADELADYFETFMRLWTGVIEYNGVERIWYWSRGMDAINTKWGNDVASRSIQYLVRTEDIEVRIDEILRGVSVAISTEEEIDRSLNASITGVPTGLLRIEVLDGSTQVD